MLRRHRNLFAIALAAAACLLVSSCDYHRLEPAGAGQIRYRDAVFTTVDTTTDVTYGKADDLTGKSVTLKLDVYAPHGDTVTKRPAIVWVHGGSFSSGDKDSAEIVDEATTFAKKGFLNVSINYRLSAGGCAPLTSDCIKAIQMAQHDAQAAVRFLRKNATAYGVDTTRIAVAGTSAGAITAYNVAFGSDSVGDSGNAGYSSKVQAAVSLSGASIATSPDKGEPPTFDLHGTDDPLVPFSWSQKTVSDAKAKGLIAEQTVWKGDGHVPYAKHRTQILDETRNFLFFAMTLRNAAH